MRTVTLFVPFLFWPDEGDPNAYADLRLGILEKLLASGKATETACDDENAWMCAQFRVQPQRDWPVAPITLYGERVDPGTDFWLRADPVHLQVHHDQLILHAPESLELGENEARALVDALNGHFAADGFTFLAPHPQRWYLKTTGLTRIRTVSLSRAIGRDINRVLPEGEDHLHWHRMFNEVQMLLHAHPVNAAREGRGAPAVNSLWFWGGGTLPVAGAPPFQFVQSDDPLTLGLTRLAGLRAISSATGVESAASEDMLIDLAHAQSAARRGDLPAWQEALRSLDSRWFAPLATLLRSGKIGRLALATVAGGRSIEWSVTRTRLWQFWKRSTPLAFHSRSLSSPQKPDPNQ